MRFMSLALLVAVSAFIFISSAKADEPAKTDPTPLFCEKGKQLLSDDFASGTLGKDWKAAKGKWEVKDGAVRGDEVAEEKHAAVLRHELEVRNLIAEFSFRFDGGKGLSLGLNDKSGHVCRAKIMPTLLQITKDRPNDKSPEKTAVLDTQILDLKPGQWHTAIVEVGGKMIVASIDGKVVAFGSHDGIDVDKTVLAFPVVGQGISLKAIHIWEGNLPADPAAAMKKLEALHAKTASAGQ